MFHSIWACNCVTCTSHLPRDITMFSARGEMEPSLSSSGSLRHSQWDRAFQCLAVWRHMAGHLRYIWFSAIEHTCHCETATHHTVFNRKWSVSQPQVNELYFWLFCFIYFIVIRWSDHLNLGMQFLLIKLLVGSGISRIVNSAVQATGVCIRRFSFTLPLDTRLLYILI